jgi:hypothetical protein
MRLFNNYEVIFLKKQSYSIWIEAEQWDGDIINDEDENSDVIVRFEDGSEWSATFFTYQNIISISEKNKTTGENLNGNYFWASDMILIKGMSRKEIEAVINELIKNGTFERVFARC